MANHTNIMDLSNRAKISHHTPHMFTVQDSESGNVIDTFETLEEAQEAVESYESDDKREWLFEKNFYEIVKS